MSASRKISQAEARRLRRENKQLRKNLSDVRWEILRWREYHTLPEGREIFRIKDALVGHKWAASTAQALGHTILVRYYNEQLIFTALPVPEAK